MKTNSLTVRRKGVGILTIIAEAFNATNTYNTALFRIKPSSQFDKNTEYSETQRL